MLMDADSLKLITRPPGLCGYATQKYCSVCGKTTINKTVSACPAPHCCNEANSSCLGVASEFDCSQVAILRATQGITAPVLYEDETVSDTTSASEQAIHPSQKTEEEALHKLEPPELVNIIKKLRSSVKRINSSVSTAGSLKRSAR